MRELSVSEINEVNGGVASLIYWAIRGGIYVYETYSATQIAYGAGAAAGSVVTLAAALDDD